MSDEIKNLPVQSLNFPDEQLPEIKSIVKLSKEYIPKLEQANIAAVKMMQEFLEIGIDNFTDVDEADLKDLLVDVREAHDKMVPLRKEMTGPLDELKKKLMTYERPLSDDKDSDYSKCRAILATLAQRKIDAKKKLEAEAAKKKEKSNHLVDIGAAVLENLHKLLLDQTLLAESKSKAWFDASTLENFDTRAEQYRKMKPTLKTEDYSACFNIDYRKDLFTPAEYADIIATIKQVETYENWNAQLVTACTPIVNAWRAKIPQLKQNLIDLKNATDESERARIADEQKRKAKEEEERRLAEAQRQSLDKSLEIQSKSEIDKMHNNFVEQATTQDLGETGPVKEILKFTDPKLALKAFTTIVVHCMSHKDFPGIEKKKDGKKVLDAQGNPEYIPAVDWWLKYFLKNCDAAVEGTIVVEAPKIIIRK